MFNRLAAGTALGLVSCSFAAHYNFISSYDVINVRDRYGSTWHPMPSHDDAAYSYEQARTALIVKQAFIDAGDQHHRMGEPLFVDFPLLRRDGVVMRPEHAMSHTNYDLVKMIVFIRNNEKYDAEVYAIAAREAIFLNEFGHSTQKNESHFFLAGFLLGACYFHPASFAILGAGIVAATLQGRANEFAADELAATKLGVGADLVKYLEQSESKSLRAIDDNSFFRFVTPTTTQRIERLKKLDTQTSSALFQSPDKMAAIEVNAKALTRRMNKS